MAATSSAKMAPHCAAIQRQRGMSARNSQSDQIATSVLSRPKKMPERTMPRCGTSSSGNATDTTSEPR